MARLKVVVLFSLCIQMALLTGCPRVAYVNAYNNTGVEVTVGEEGGASAVVPPGGETTFRFTGYAVIVESTLGHWWYERNIPGGGQTGEFFDGTLRVQIEPDGALYALRPRERAPKTHFPGQPDGFPLVPSTKASER